MKCNKLFYVILGILLISGCTPAASSLTPFVTTSQAAPTSLPTPGAFEPQETPETLLSTAVGEALVPAGWVTHTSQLCEYAISFPSEMEVTEQNTYSQTFGFKLANPDEGARNFIYVSVINPEIQNMVSAGIYNNDVYNYDPAAADILLNMQVGERVFAARGTECRIGVYLPASAGCIDWRSIRPGLREPPAVGVSWRYQGNSIFLITRRVYLPGRRIHGYDRVELNRVP